MVNDGRLVDVYEDLAMVSRIRVEVRGGSMKAAERVATLLLDHARMAGLLEGIVPHSSRFTDHFFNYPQMVGKPSDPPDPWSELGMRYYGRLAITCDPEVALGGLKEFGYEVMQVDNYTPHGLADHPGSCAEPVRTDVTDKVIVLNRVNEAVRDEHYYPTISAPGSPVADAEEILDNIRRLANVADVEVSYDRTQRDGSGWRVNVTFKPEPPAHPDSVPVTLSVGKATLREAALDAYGGCGVEVTHYDTVSDVEPEHRVTISVAELNVPMVVHQLAGYPYRWLVVGSETAAEMANAVIAASRETYPRARDLQVRIDDEHTRDYFTLTTAESGAV